MDTYEKLEVQPDAPPPPPPPDLPPPKSTPLMPPMKEQKEKFNEHELKPLRAGDDVNLSDTPKRPLLPNKEPSAKPNKSNPESKQKGNKKSPRPIAGKSARKSKSSQSTNPKSTVQIILLVAIGVSLAFALIFMFMTVFGLLHLVGVLKVVEEFSPTMCS